MKRKICELNTQIASWFLCNINIKINSIIKELYEKIRLNVIFTYNNKENMQFYGRIHIRIVTDK